MLEFLFCPQHGLLRAENIQLMLGYGGAILLDIELWYVRIMSRVGRFL